MYESSQIKEFRWTTELARIRKTRNAHRILIGKSFEFRELVDLKEDVLSDWFRIVRIGGSGILLNNDIIYFVFSITAIHMYEHML